MTLQRNPEARCETCPYFDKAYVLPDADGWCRRKSPQPVWAEDMTLYLFPKMDRGAWCGDHPDFPLPGEPE